MTRDMAKFIEVGGAKGGTAINIDHISIVEFFEDRNEIYIYLAGQVADLTIEGELQNQIWLNGEDARAFKAWWDSHADVYKCS